MNHSKVYVFFGNVGAGKGTQVLFLKNFLKEKFGKNVVHISPGAEYRKVQEKDLYAANFVKRAMNTGYLLPTFLTSYVVYNLLINALQGPDDLIVFDGFPRNLEQVKVFEESMNFFEKGKAEIIHINISREEAVRRMEQRNRHDDNAEAIKNRFGEYEKNVLPSLEYLKSKGYNIHSINGEQEAEKVSIDILKAMGF